MQIGLFGHIHRSLLPHRVKAQASEGLDRLYEHCPHSREEEEEEEEEEESLFKADAVRRRKVFIDWL